MKGRSFWLMFLPLAGMVVLGLVNHELWLDEMHHWLLARDSASLAELNYNARYEGHPLLWNVMLWMLARFTDSPYAMQVLHGVLALAVLAVWIRWAPLPWWLVLLGALGYFLLYEYAALSRNYALGVLGLFGAAAVLKGYERPFVLATVCCLLAVHSHLLLLIPGVALWVYALVTYWPKERQKTGVLAVVIFIVLLLPALWWSVPARDHTYLQFNAVGLWSWERMEFAWHQVTKALLPFPDPARTNWWNHSWLEERIDNDHLFALLGLALVAAMAFSLRKHRGIMLFFVASVLGILCFAWLSEMRANRYYGGVWIAFLVAWWLGPGRIPWRWRWPQFLLTGLVVIQAIAGLTVWSLDLTSPFSQGKSAAKYIRSEGLSQLPILSFQECAAISVSGYLATTACYPQTGHCGGFCHWTHIPNPQSMKRFMDSLHTYKSNGSKLLVLNSPLPETLPDGVTALQSFTGSTVRFEEIYLYRWD